MHAILAEMIVERGKSEVDPIIYQFPKFIPCEPNLIWWTCIVSSTYMMCTMISRNEVSLGYSRERIYPLIEIQLDCLNRL